jgi:hypothetical protein
MSTAQQQQTQQNEKDPKAPAGASQAPGVAPLNGPPPEGTSAGASGASAEQPKPPRAVDLAAIARERQRTLKAKHEADAVAAKNAADRATLEQERANLAKREEKVAAIRSKVELLPKEPEKALELLGIDKDNFFRRVLNNGQASPEEQIKALSAKLEEQQKALEERDKAEKERNARARVQAEQQREVATVRDVATQIMRAEEHFPNLTELYEEREIAQQLAEVHTWAKQNGQRYSADEVANFLEKRAASINARIQERRAKRVSASASETEADGSTRSAGGSEATGRTRTLTNKAATSKASPPKHLTEDEQDEANLAAIRKAVAEDRKSRG